MLTYFFYIIISYSIFFATCGENTSCYFTPGDIMYVSPFYICITQRSVLQLSVDPILLTQRNDTMCTSHDGSDLGVSLRWGWSDENITVEDSPSNLTCISHPLPLVIWHVLLYSRHHPAILGKTHQRPCVRGHFSFLAK